MKTGGIYIHIPFCKQKCLYCDFYTGGARIANWKEYVDCLINELKDRREEIDFSPETLYIGGGTPSLIPSGEFLRMICEINKLCGISEWKEFTIEVNPEDVDNNKIETWLETGVNRISIGIQSLNDRELKKIGRRHNSSTALKALENLKTHLRNISVDVMFGLPGQTLESYKETITNILKYQPQHISSYSLMLEEGTAMTLLENQGKIILPDEDEWLEMFGATVDLLKEHGYTRYELSNYSLEGYESCHNKSYWENKPYLGIGAGAHSYDGKSLRRWNPNDIKGYIKNFNNGQDKEHPSFYREEILTSGEIREEKIMTRLRTVKGLNLTEFENEFGKESYKKLLQKANEYILKGLMKEKNNCLFITEEGFLIYNTIVSDLI